MLCFILNILFIISYQLTESCNIVVFCILNEVKWFFQHWSWTVFSTLLMLGLKIWILLLLSIRRFLQSHLVLWHLSVSHVLEMCWTEVYKVRKHHSLRWMTPLTWRGWLKLKLKVFKPEERSTVKLPISVPLNTWGNVVSSLPTMCISFFVAISWHQAHSSP